MNPKKKILYISYDGILEPLGSSQVLKYITHSSFNENISLISFEKKEDFKNNKNIQYLIENLSKNKIDWHHLYYSKSFGIFSKSYDILKAIILILNLLRKNKYEIIHSRSYLPTFIAILISFFFRKKIIFDMRGFWVDERYEWSIWKKKKIFYIFLKYIEKKLIKSSSFIVVLCNDAKLELQKKYKVPKNMIEVIPTCVDTEQFNLSFPSNKKDKIIICQIGTIQTRYNVHFTFKFLKELNKTYNTKIIFINKNEHKKILDLCKKYNLKSDQFEVLHSDHSKVHEIIRLAKFSIFFSKNGYFKKGFFPTKIAESLSCGIPIITSSINNHIDKIIVDNTFGVLIKDNNNISIKEGIKKIELFLVKNNFKKDMRNFVIKNLSIKYATNKYDNIYKYLLKI